MGRKRFDRAFKLEAGRLVRERGVSAAQAARDLDVHENVLRKRVKEFAADPQHAFPGQGQMKPEQQEIDRLRREVVRDILMRPQPFSRSSASSRSTAGSGRWHGCAQPAYWGRLEFVRPTRGGSLYADRRVSVGAEVHQVVPDRAGAQHNALEFVARAFVRRQDLRNQQVAIFGDSLVRHFAAAQFVF